MDDSIAARRPQADEHNPYYDRYISLVPDGSVVATLEREGARAVALYAGLDEETTNHAYAAGKWTVRQALVHVTDTERLFAFRALAFGRGDAGPLPGMEPDDWMRHVHGDRRPWAEMVDELRSLRAATVHLFRGFAAEDWERRGVASNHEVSVRALAWILAGHELHHRRLLFERYGVDAPA